MYKGQTEICWGRSASQFLCYYSCLAVPSSLTVEISPTKYSITSMNFNATTSRLDLWKADWKNRMSCCEICHWPYPLSKTSGYIFGYRHKILSNSPLKKLSIFVLSLLRASNNLVQFVELIEKHDRRWKQVYRLRETGKQLRDTSIVF